MAGTSYLGMEELSMDTSLVIFYIDRLSSTSLLSDYESILVRSLSRCSEKIGAIATARTRNTTESPQ